MDDTTLQALTTRIVAANVSRNALPAAELGTLIGTVQASLRALGRQPSAAPVHTPTPARTPAVPIRRSVSTNAIVCLEYGKAQKILRRHLAAAHDLTPETYKARWGLPDEYPMTAPDYAAARSELAKAAGLGRKGGRRRKAYFLGRRNGNIAITAIPDAPFLAIAPDHGAERREVGGGRIALNPAQGFWRINRRRLAMSRFWRV